MPLLFVSLVASQEVMRCTIWLLVTTLESTPILYLPSGTRLQAGNRGFRFRVVAVVVVVASI